MLIVSISLLRGSVTRSENFFLSEFFFILSPLFRHTNSLIYNHLPTHSRRCAILPQPSLYNVACRRSALCIQRCTPPPRCYMTKILIAGRPALWPVSHAPSLRPRAACARLKCASMPRRRDPRTCLPVERSRRRCHTWIVCCASSRRPDRARPPINSGRVPLPGGIRRRDPIMQAKRFLNFFPCRISGRARAAA